MILIFITSFSFSTFISSRPRYLIHGDTYLKGDIADLNILERPLSEKHDLRSSISSYKLCSFFLYLVGSFFNSWLLYVRHGVDIIARKCITVYWVGVDSSLLLGALGEV